VAGSLGYCGLDRRRQPLAGDEIRPCWEAWPAGADPTSTEPAVIRPAGDAAPAAERAARLDFVEVDEPPMAPVSPASATPASAGAGAEAEPAGPGLDAPVFVPPPGPPGDPGWSLWGDLDR
jgi:hypothetical protein